MRIATTLPVAAARAQHHVSGLRRRNPSIVKDAELSQQRCKALRRSGCGKATRLMWSGGARQAGPAGRGRYAADKAACAAWVFVTPLRGRVGRQHRPSSRIGCGGNSYRANSAGAAVCSNARIIRLDRSAGVAAVIGSLSRGFAWQAPMCRNLPHVWAGCPVRQHLISHIVAFETYCVGSVAARRHLRESVYRT